MKTVTLQELLENFNLTILVYLSLFMIQTLGLLAKYELKILCIALFRNSIGSNDNEYLPHALSLLSDAKAGCIPV